MDKPFTLTTGDPRFNPREMVLINGFPFTPTQALADLIAEMAADAAAKRDADG